MPSKLFPNCVFNYRLDVIEKPWLTRPGYYSCQPTFSRGHISCAWDFFYVFFTRVPLIFPRNGIMSQIILAILMTAGGGDRLRCQQLPFDSLQTTTSLTNWLICLKLHANSLKIQVQLASSPVVCLSVRAISFFLSCFLWLLFYARYMCVHCKLSNIS